MRCIGETRACHDYSSATSRQDGGSKCPSGSRPKGVGSASDCDKAALPAIDAGAPEGRPMSERSDLTLFDLADADPAKDRAGARRALPHLRGRRPAPLAHATLLHVLRAGALRGRARRPRPRRARDPASNAATGSAGQRPEGATRNGGATRAPAIVRTSTDPIPGPGPVQWRPTTGGRLCSGSGRVVREARHRWPGVNGGVPPVGCAPDGEARWAAGESGVPRPGR